MTRIHRVKCTSSIYRRTTEEGDLDVTGGGQEVLKKQKVTLDTVCGSAKILMVKLRMVDDSHLK